MFRPGDPKDDDCPPGDNRVRPPKPLLQRGRCCGGLATKPTHRNNARGGVRPTGGTEGLRPEVYTKKPLLYSFPRKGRRANLTKLNKIKIKIKIKIKTNLLDLLIPDELNQMPSVSSMIKDAIAAEGSDLTDT